MIVTIPIPLAVVSTLLAWASWMMFIKDQSAHIEDPHVPVVVPRESPDDVSDSEVAALSAALRADQKGYLLDLICRPKSYVRRISETVRFAGSSIEIETAIVIDELDVEGSSSYFIPVHWQKKEQEIDGLRILDDSGHRVSTLASRESFALMLTLAFDLIEQLRGDNVLTAQDALTTKERVRAIATENSPERSTSLYNESFSEESGTLPGIGSKKTLSGSYLRLLVGRMTQNYPIIVLVSRLVEPVAPESSTDVTADTSANVHPLDYPNAVLKRGRRLTVRTLEQPVAHQRPAPSGWNLERRLERALFVEPPKIMREISNAARARSFHMTVHSPGGWYFYNMTIRRGAETTNHAAAPQSHASARDLQDFGHLYMRGAVNAIGSYAVTTFREKIPGSITEATLASGLTAMLIGAVFVAHGGVFTNLFSLLIPLIFATIGTGTIWRTITQIGEPYPGRLASRIVSLVTFLTAVVAVFRSAFDARQLSGCGDQLRQCTVWDSSLWILLLIVSLTAFLFALTAWRVDLKVERAFRESPDPEHSNVVVESIVEIIQ